MRPPRIKSVLPQDDHLLIVEFDNDAKRLYDVAPLLTRAAFQALRDPTFFRAVKIDIGGYAIYWDENIDLSENELWVNGQTIDS